MIYMQLTDGRHLLILEPSNLERLKLGEMATTPDGKVAVTYTPDMVWLSAAMAAAIKAGHLDGETIVRLLTEGAKREPVFQRDAHPPQEIIRNGELVREDA